MIWRKRSVSVLAWVALSALSVTPAKAATYTIVNYADNTGPYGTFEGPSINNSGTVVFFASLDTGVTGIFNGPDPALHAVADSTGPYQSFNPLPTINDAGTVVFLATFDMGGSGVFTGPDPNIDTIADTNGPFSGFGIGEGFLQASINGNGVVAFSASLDAGGAGIFTGSNPDTDTVADTNGPFRAIGSPVINDAGKIAFVAYLDFDPNGGIFTGPTPATDTFVDTFGPYHPSLINLPSINNAGAIAFWAALDTGGSGIFTGPNPNTDTFVDSSGPYTGGGPPSINDSGTIAFLGRLDTGADGIFIGPDPVTDTVVKTGETLFGSTVTAIGFFRGLNDNGQIAFFYRLQDGRQGIAVANPVQCNNAVIDPGEQCDDGLLNGTIESCCTLACTLEANGATCDDGDACTQIDQCEPSGICSGSDPVICTARDACHEAGACDSTSGVCSDPPKAGGAACDDGDPCTAPDTCDGQGECTAGPLVIVGEVGNVSAIVECAVSKLPLP